MLLQLNYITPSGGGVLALMVVLDGVGKDFGFDLQSSLLTLGRADASIAGFRREWGLTPLCEAAATFSGYSEGLSRLSLNRNLLAFALGVLLSAKDNGL